MEKQYGDEIKVA